jgi:hypothetical protein
VDLGSVFEADLIVNRVLIVEPPVMIESGCRP